MLTSASSPSSTPTQRKVVRPTSSPMRSAMSPDPQSPDVHVISLKKPNGRNPSRARRMFRRVRAVFRSFPIIMPSCRNPLHCHKDHHLNDGHIHGGTRMTGTLFGYRKARVNLAIQENPSSLPILLLELAVPTGKLLKDMGMGLVRIALEHEKNPSEKKRIIDEPAWTMYYNGKRTGYGIKREPTNDDLVVMQILHVNSMGAGVIPSWSSDQVDGELTYMRAYFDRVIGSKDSETYYVMNPEGNHGPELSIFFVRM